MNNLDDNELSDEAIKLLNQLVQDYYSRLPKKERILNVIEDRAAIIYNLFNGNYKFNYEAYKEILNYLCNDGTK